MNSYKNYIHVLRSILKNFDDNQFDDIIKNILIKIFDIYYLERHIQQYNIDNVFKRHNMDMYNLLCRKYLMTKRLMFIKHKYDKKEYIINLLKKNKNFILKDNETYKSIADKQLTRIPMRYLAQSSARFVISFAITLRSRVILMMGCTKNCILTGLILLCYTACQKFIRTEHRCDPYVQRSEHPRTNSENLLLT